MVAMAALDAGGSASSNYARMGQPYRAEKRLAEHLTAPFSRSGLAAIELLAFIVWRRVRRGGD